MSLEALRALRRSGKRPSGPILAIVGNQPKHHKDMVTEFVVQPTDKPEAMDMRPLVGLWVAVLVMDKSEPLGGRVLEAAMKAGAKIYGVALPDRTVHMGIEQPTRAHIRNLIQTWDAYQ